MDVVHNRITDIQPKTQLTEESIFKPRWILNILIFLSNEPRTEIKLETRNVWMVLYQGGHTTCVFCRLYKSLILWFTSECCLYVLRWGHCFYDLNIQTIQVFTAHGAVVFLESVVKNVYWTNLFPLHILNIPQAILLKAKYVLFPRPWLCCSILVCSWLWCLSYHIIEIFRITTCLYNTEKSIASQN